MASADTLAGQFRTKIQPRARASLKHLIHFAGVEVFPVLGEYLADDLGQLQFMAGCRLAGGPFQQFWPPKTQFAPPASQLAR